jgi:hypothetical protein
MGTIYVAEVQNSSKFTRQIPFEFNEAEAYVIEFSENKIRFLKNNELVLSVGIPYVVTSTYLESELADLDYTQSGDVLYIVHKNHFPKTLARYSDTNWVLADAVIQDGPYAAVNYLDKNNTLRLTNYSHTAIVTSTVAEFSASTLTYTGVTPDPHVEYYEEGLLVIAKVSSYIGTTKLGIIPLQNIVDFAGIDKEAVITWVSGSAYSSLAIWSTETSYSYIKIEDTWYYMTSHQSYPEQIGSPPNSYSADVMLAASHRAPDVVPTTGVLTVTDNVITATLTSSLALFSAGRDVGRHFRMTIGKKNVWGWITSVTDSKTAAVRLGTPLPLDPKDRTTFIGGGQSTNWRLGAWYVGNYPQAVTIHQQRLIFAGTPAEPNRVAMSMIDDFVSFSTANKFAEVLDTSGINFSVGTGEVNPIRWMQSGPVLLIGTQGEEFQVKPSNISDPLSPTNISITQQTPYGGRKNIQPIKVGPATLFVQKHGVSVREMTYSFEIDSFTASDLTVVAEHIIRDNGYAVAMCYQQIPNSIVWVCCSNGKLLSFTYEKDHQVFAWAQHELPGGFIESICRIPNNAINKDSVYMIVKRTIDGATKRYHEYLAPEFQPSSNTDKVGMIYLDSCKSYSGAPTTAITGLTHLEGQTVSIMADGSQHPERVVTGGAITLEWAASIVHVGLKYTSYIKTLSLEGGSQFGTSIGKLKKIQRLDIQLHATIGLKYGRNYPETGDTLSFVESEPFLGQSPNLFSGFVQLRDDAGFNYDGQFCIVQDQCYPCTILSLMPTVIVNE